jgi:hypothetical protein
MQACAEHEASVQMHCPSAQGRVMPGLHGAPGAGGPRQVKVVPSQRRPGAQSPLDVHGMPRLGRSSHRLLVGLQVESGAQSPLWPHGWPERGDGVQSPSSQCDVSRQICVLEQGEPSLCQVTGTGAATGVLATHVPPTQSLPGSHSVSASQGSPSDAAFAQTPQVFGLAARQRWDAHCVAKMQASPPARVPAVAQAGTSVRRTASQEKVRHSAAHAAVPSGVRVEPAAKITSGQVRVTSSM